MNEQQPTAEEVMNLTDADVRYVAIIWKDSTTDEFARPRVVIGGEMSQYEAAALLRAASAKLEIDNMDLMEFEDEDESEEDDETA